MRINDYLRQSNLIEGFDNPDIDAESVRIWAWFTSRLRDHKYVGKQYTLTHQTIQELQSRIVAHQPDQQRWAGVYRDRSHQRVFIGDSEAMKPEHVGRAMDEWLENLREHDAFENHRRFELIHPFSDGNGRTGRMLLWWQQKYIENRPMSYIPYEKRERYYKWFSDENPDYSL